jgi:hypothetical protein
MITHFINSEMLVAVRHVMRGCPDFKLVTGIPLECERVEVDFDEGSHNDATGIPSAMVLNLDETLHQDWAYIKDIRIVVPVSCDGNSIHMSCDRSSKRTSLLVCIAADGTFVQPMVIVPRHTPKQELSESSYTPDRVPSEHQENGFISTQLFQKWATGVFFSMWKLCDEDMRMVIRGFCCWMTAYLIILTTFLIGAMILVFHHSFSLRTLLISHNLWTWVYSPYTSR